jgi:cystinosin
VSLVCWALLGAIVLFLSASLIATLAGAISWLLLLNFCSYVKLGITLVKYIPQAIMNYR